MNVVVLRGVLSRAPESRELPSGSQLVAYEVTVRTEGLPTESVPVTWLDPPARATTIASGKEVVVVGRVRRRFFRAGGVTASRTEVVAQAVLPATQRKRVDAAVAKAVAAIGSG